MDCFPLEGFNHVTNIGVLICDIFVWSDCWRCSVFWEYPVYPNILEEISMCNTINMFRFHPPSSNLETLLSLTHSCYFSLLQLFLAFLFLWLNSKKETAPSFVNCCLFCIWLLLSYILGLCLFMSGWFCHTVSNFPLASWLAQVALLLMETYFPPN